MKKVLIAIFAVILCCNVSYAKLKTKLYEVENIKPSSLIETISKSMDSIDYPTKIVDKKNNIIYSNNNHVYYIKAYDYRNGSKIFFTSDKKSKISKIIDKTGFELQPVKNKNVVQIHNKEFKIFARNNDIKIPSKKKKGKFKPYKKKLKNEKLFSKELNEKNINIVVNKYKLKTTTAKYAEGYEYLITNKNKESVVLNDIWSADFMTRREITNKVAFDKSYLIPIYGIVVASKTDYEKMRFTRAMPTNLMIKPNEKVRVLALVSPSYISEVEFNFTVDSKEQKIFYKETN